MHVHTDQQTRKLGYQNVRTWTTCTNKPEVASPNAYVHIHNHARTQKYLQKHFHAPCVPARSNKKSEVFWFGVLLWVTRSAWFMFAFTCCLSWRILLSWWRSAMYACVCRLCECVNLAVLMMIWNVCVCVGEWGRLMWKSDFCLCWLGFAGRDRANVCFMHMCMYRVCVCVCVCECPSNYTMHIRMFVCVRVWIRLK
jgi:hypothetical protein